MGNTVNTRNGAITTPTESKPTPFTRSGETGREINKTYNRSYGQFSDDFFTKAGTPGKVEKGIGGLLGRLGNRTLAEGSFEKSKTGYSKANTFSTAGGKVNGQYSVDIGKVGVSGSGSVGLKDGAFVAKGGVKAEATLIDAKASAKAKFGMVEANGDAYLYAGARAKADGTLTIDPKRGIYGAEVGGEAFAGVKAGVSGDVSLGKYGGVGGRAEAWAGVGAQFRAQVGYKNGKFSARVDIGAALGIGFKLGFNVNIDVKGLVNKAKELLNKPIELAKKAVDAVKDFGHKAVDTVKNIGHSIGNAVKKLKFW